MFEYRFEEHTLKSLFANYLTLPINASLFEENSALSFLSSSIDPKEIMLSVMDKDKVIALAALEHIDEYCLLKKYICVDPAYRFQGLGEFLLKKWYEYAKKHNKYLIHSIYSHLGQKHLMSKDKRLAQLSGVTCFNSIEEYQWCM